VNLDLPVTGAEAARFLSCPRRRVQDWRRAGHLAPIEGANTRRPKYRLGDVLEAERVTRRHPNSHRRSEMPAP